MVEMKCVACGKEISTSAKFCPYCGRKDPTSEGGSKAKGCFIGCLIPTIIGLAIVIIVSISAFHDEDSQQDTREPSPTQHKKQKGSQSSVQRKQQDKIPFPVKQLKFHNLNEPFKYMYKHASNEIQKSAVFNDCNKTRGKYLVNQSLRFNNWIGELIDISTDQGGDVASIRIRSDAADFRIYYQTHNNRLSDSGVNSLLRKGTAIYNQLSEINEYEYVLFSGSFVPDNEKGIKERSITEKGCVSEPEFIIRFTSVKKLRK